MLKLKKNGTAQADLSCWPVDHQQHSLFYVLRTQPRGEVRLFRAEGVIGRARGCEFSLGAGRPSLFYVFP